MPRWLDPYPGSPVVSYEFEDGSQVPFARSQMEALGGAPLPPPEPAPAAVPEPSAVPELAPFPTAPAPPTAAAPALAPSPFGSAPSPSPTARTVSGIPVPAIATPPTAPGSAPAPALPAVPSAPSQTEKLATIEQEQRPDFPVELVPRIEPLFDQDIGQGKRPAAPGIANERAPESAWEVEQRKRDRETNAMDDYVAKANQIAEAEQEFLETSQKTYERISRDAAQAVQKAADYRVDPKRRWNQLSTGSKVMSVLFLALGGIGAAMKREGDKNPALDIFRAQMDEDVNLQLAEKDQLGRDAERKRALVGDFRMFAADRTAEFHARRASLWRQLAERTEQIGKAASSENVRFEAAAQAAAMMGEAEKDQEAAAQKAFENEMKVAEFELSRAKNLADVGKTEAETAKLLRSGSGAGAASKKMSGTFGSIDDIHPSLQDQAVLMPDGSFVIAASRDAKKEADKLIVDSHVMTQSLDRAMSKVASLPNVKEKLANKLGWTSEDVAVIQQELGQVITTAKNYLQLGALAGPDMALIEKLGADPSAITKTFDQKSFEKLANWRNGVVADSQTRIRQYVGRDFDAKAAFGDAPQRPREKTFKEVRDELAAMPPENVRRQVVRSTDGEERVTEMPAFELPAIEELRSSLDVLEETAKADKKPPEELARDLGDLKLQIAFNQAKLRKQAVDLNGQAEAARKKGDKKAAGVLESRARAAGSGAQEYDAHLKEIERRRSALTKGVEAKKERERQVKENLRRLSTLGVKTK